LMWRELDRQGWEERDRRALPDAPVRRSAQSDRKGSARARGIGFFGSVGG
jgi:hypothetical protein